jgi:hypothetical protein
MSFWPFFRRVKRDVADLSVFLDLSNGQRAVTIAHRENRNGVNP